MRKLFGPLAGLLVGLMIAVAGSALALSEHEIENGGVIKVLGTGVAVTCDTTPNTGSDCDDTSIANTEAIRTLECCNPDTNTVTVRIGGTSVGANAAGLAPGICKTWTLAASVVPKCYAASSTTIQCTEYR